MLHTAAAMQAPARHAPFLSCAAAMLRARAASSGARSSTSAAGTLLWCLRQQRGGQRAKGLGGGGGEGLLAGSQWFASKDGQTGRLSHANNCQKQGCSVPAEVSQQLQHPLGHELRYHRALMLRGQACGGSTPRQGKA